MLIQASAELVRARHLELAATAANARRTRELRRLSRETHMSRLRHGVEAAARGVWHAPLRREPAEVAQPSTR